MVGATRAPSDENHSTAEVGKETAGVHLVQTLCSGRANDRKLCRTSSRWLLEGHPGRDIQGGTSRQSLRQSPGSLLGHLALSSAGHCKLMCFVPLAWALLPPASSAGTAEQLLAHTLTAGPDACSSSSHLYHSSQSPLGVQELGTGKKLLLNVRRAWGHVLLPPEHTTPHPDVLEYSQVSKLLTATSASCKKLCPDQ